MKCRKCHKDTTKIIDGVPICKDCMLKDAAANRGRVIDYSGLRKPEEGQNPPPEPIDTRDTTEPRPGDTPDQATDLPEKPAPLKPKPEKKSSKKK